MNNKFEEYFIDYLEGMLAVTQREEMEKALQDDPRLKQSFLEYQHVIDLEKHLAKVQPALSPNFLVKLMDRIEKEDSRRAQNTRRIYKEPKVNWWKFDLANIAIFAALVAVCITTFALRSKIIEQIRASSQSLKSFVASTDDTNTVSLTNYSQKIQPKEKRKEAVASDVHAKINIDAFKNFIKQSEDGSEIRDGDSALLKNETVPAKPESAIDQVENSQDKSQSKEGELPKINSANNDSSATSYKRSEQDGNYKENLERKGVSELDSTFSINVGTASYSNARRFLAMGEMPPKYSVRVEEFINYFDYNYPKQTENPFALHYEIAPSPLAPLDKSRYLLKIGVKAKDSIGDNNFNLAFLVHLSGSRQSSNKIALIKSGLRLLVDKMKPTDRIAIVTAAGASGVALDSTTVSEKEKILKAIDGLAVAGSTSSSAEIVQAYRVANGHYISGAVNRVILATDIDLEMGVNNLDELIKFIEEKRESGITLNALGVGDSNLNDYLLEELAGKGNGNYFYLDNFKEVNKLFEQNLSYKAEVVAKDVKLQIKFNPKEVLEYHLIGYDNRKLDKQDSNNEAIGTGEVRSGHSVTAMYEVALVGSELEKSQITESSDGENKQSLESKGLSAFSSSGILAFLKVRYKAPEAKEFSILEFPIERAKIKQELSETSDDFRFAAAVSYFGTVLRESDFKGKYSLTEIADLASKSKGSDPFGQRQDFINFVKNAQMIMK